MRPAFFVPLGVFLLIALALGVGLGLKPREIPSALIGKPVPAFELPALLEGEEGLSDADLKTGRVALLNFFAEWCAPCKIEHPVLLKFAAERGTPLFGIDYKDNRERARHYLATRGNPYRKIGEDASGRAGIDFGISGVPETFVIDGEGRILYKHIGPIQERDLQETILPILAGRAP